MLESYVDQLSRRGRCLRQDAALLLGPTGVRDAQFEVPDLMFLAQGIWAEQQRQGLAPHASRCLVTTFQLTRLPSFRCVALVDSSTQS